MRIVSKIEDMKTVSSIYRSDGLKIGFVPTMGYLHEGHLSLVRLSVNSCDRTVVSIFVNPSQFAPHEDFSSYPRDLERDLEILRCEGVDIVFTPDSESMYPLGYKTFVEVSDLQEKLCGMTRPHFFRGVCTIVLKLLHVVSPDTAFFGQKDAQQWIILKKMVSDLNMDTRIEVGPIIRDRNGLALSSRNAYLDETGYGAALSLFRGLKIAEDLIAGGIRVAGAVGNAVKKEIESEPRARIDYILIVDSEHLNPVEIIEPGTLIALAVFIDEIRLIDNIIVSPDLERSE